MSGTKSNSSRPRLLAASSMVGGLVFAAAAVAAVGVRVARVVVTPPRRRIEDIRILSVDGDSITLSSNPDTRLPGRYGLWFSRATGHAKLGPIRSHTDSTVTRELIGVDYGDLASATRAYLGGWVELNPDELGLAFETVQIETDLGPAPAWLIPSTSPASRWVIGVHGRGVRKAECLRAVPVFARAGYTSLLISYRNDGEAPDSSDHRFGLGDTEWRDVDAALEFAIAHGATDVVLMGWSMGGATVLQAINRSRSRVIVRGIVLESPVVDWVTTLNYQAKQRHIPRPLRGLVLALIGRSWGSRFTGQAEPVDLARLDFVTRAAELTVPILVLHSADDGFVPPTASRALAAARPDIVSYDEFTVARHTKLWNYDPERWNNTIAGWLKALPATSGRTPRSRHPREVGSE